MGTMSHPVPEGEHSSAEQSAKVPSKTGEPDVAAVNRNLLLKLHPSSQSQECVEDELRRLRESGEISKESIPFSEINDYFSQYFLPIMRRALGNPPRAVVLTKNEVFALGCFAFINSAGQLEVMDSEDMNGDLVLLPKHFGNLDDTQANKEFLNRFPNGLGVIE